jgi:hypothetical protein
MLHQFTGTNNAIKFKNMRTKHLLLAILGLFFITQGNAQDTIFKKNQEIIICNIVKVGINEIEYNQVLYNSNAIITLAKSRVSKVVLANGQILNFAEEMHSPVDYKLQKKNIIKVDFLSPYFGYLGFGYEKSLGMQRSVEFNLGIIGLGFTPNKEDLKGAFGKIGYKFIRSPEVYYKAGNFPHILKGSFIRPEITFSYFTQSVEDPIYYGNYIDYSHRSIETNYSAALMVALGKQWISESEKFSVSWYYAFGYTLSNDSDYNEVYYYSHISGPSEFPFSMMVGVNVGFVY